MLHHKKIVTKKLPVATQKEFHVYTILFTTGTALVTAFLFFWFQPQHIPHNFSGYYHIFDIIFFALLTYVVWYQIITEFFSWIIVFSMKRPEATIPEENKRVAFLTAFVPGKEPYDVLEATINAMTKADYSHDTWLLDEGDDDEAKRLCELYGVRYFTRHGNPIYNTTTGPFKTKTKGGNYNSWFYEYGHFYDYVAQLDVDFVPKKDFLTKTLGFFRDPHVAFVGTPQVYGNTDQSWIARGAAEQAYNFYGAMQKGFFGQDMTLFIGANHVVRVAAHEQVGGYSGHIVEDHLTGMRFYANKWKSVYVPEILAVGEGPATWDAYFSQQMRWAYGLIHILFTESPSLFKRLKNNHILNYFILQHYYFYGLSQVIGVVLLCSYFIFGFQATTMTLLPLLALYIPLIVWQNVIFVWLQRYNIDPKHESGLMLRGKLLNVAAWPIYFMAFLGVIIGKRMTYNVTPKGSNQVNKQTLSLFAPHFLLGTATLVCLIFAALTNRHAPLLLFWTIVNTVLMYYFVLSAIFEKILVLIKKNSIWESLIQTEPGYNRI